jgi:hypothetical protein
MFYNIYNLSKLFKNHKWATITKGPHGRIDQLVEDNPASSTIYKTRSVIECDLDNDVSNPQNSALIPESSLGKNMEQILCDKGFLNKLLESNNKMEKRLEELESKMDSL